MATIGTHVFVPGMHVHGLVHGQDSNKNRRMLNQVGSFKNLHVDQHRVFEKNAILVDPRPMNPDTSYATIVLFNSRLPNCTGYIGDNVDDTEFFLNKDRNIPIAENNHFSPSDSTWKNYLDDEGYVILDIPVEDICDDACESIIELFVDAVDSINTKEDFDNFYDLKNIQALHLPFSPHQDPHNIETYGFSHSSFSDMSRMVSRKYFADYYNVTEDKLTSSFESAFVVPPQPENMKTCINNNLHIQESTMWHKCIRGRIYFWGNNNWGTIAQNVCFMPKDKREENSVSNMLQLRQSGAVSSFNPIFVNNISSSTPDKSYIIDMKPHLKICIPGTDRDPSFQILCPE